nr:probable glycosyltransferase At5g03795 [Tanacetum cinerariifolium]
GDTIFGIELEVQIILLLLVTIRPSARKLAPNSSETLENKDPDMKIFGKLQKNSTDYTEYMKSSKYCIRAKGYEVNSPRVVEAIFHEWTNSWIPGRLVPGDTNLGRLVVRDTFKGKARWGFFPRKLSPTTMLGPHSFSHTMKCHGEGVTQDCVVIKKLRKDD